MTAVSLFIIFAASLILLTCHCSVGALYSEHGDGDNASSLVQCPQACRQPHSQSTGLRIFYLVILHNERTMNDAVHLYRAIRSPMNTVLFHMDAKASHLFDDVTSALYREVAECSCGSKTIMKSVHASEWSRWSMNLPTLWGMQVAVDEYYDDWDVFINLSGDTLPVYTPQSLSTVLQDLPYNFVTSRSCETGLVPTIVYTFPHWWHKRSHYTKGGTINDPVFDYTDADTKQRQVEVSIHFGSQWVILQKSFCSWLVRDLERPDSLSTLYKTYLQASSFLMTDETFIATLLMHMPEFVDTIPPTDGEDNLIWANGTSSHIRHVRYERMDEHIPTSYGRLWTDQRYDVPDSSIADKPRVWGPYYLGVYDLADIRDSGALFIRKVSTEVDHNMVAIFPVDDSTHIPYIEWPYEVKVTDKPRWKRQLKDDSGNGESEGEL